MPKATSTMQIKLKSKILFLPHRQLCENAYVWWSLKRIRSKLGVVLLWYAVKNCYCIFPSTYVFSIFILPYCLCIHYQHLHGLLPQLSPHPSLLFSLFLEQMMNSCENFNEVGRDCHLTRICQTGLNQRHEWMYKIVNDGTSTRAGIMKRKHKRLLIHTNGSSRQGFMGHENKCQNLMMNWGISCCHGS